MIGEVNSLAVARALGRGDAAELRSAGRARTPVPTRAVPTAGRVTINEPV